MDMGILFSELFRLDESTTLKIIIWGNLFIGLLVSMYWSVQKNDEHSGSLVRYAMAKYLQCAGWLLSLVMGYLPDVVAVNIGSTLLFFGLLIESRVILAISGTKRTWPFLLQVAVFAVLVAGFNAFEFFFDMRAVRMVGSVFVIMIIMSFPGFACLRHGAQSRLKIVLGVLYSLLFVFATIRVVEEALRVRILLFSPGMIPGLIQLSMIAVLFIGGAGFLLLVKESTDRKILELAYLDHLTGLLNRRHFTEEALAAFERHGRYGEEMTILFLDLDHFKMINDMYGHPFGDDVLRDFASHIRRSVRTSDLSCRWGGEEFIILLSNTTRHHSMAVARRLQLALTTSRFPQHSAFSYTASVGMFCAVPRAVPGDTLESFIEKADKAMYRAKESGRNCVVVYE
jgi:diguanylate cyclase (GGDEF)-like protein